LEPRASMILVQDAGSSWFVLHFKRMFLSLSETEEKPPCSRSS
jgi:hypothetical protein